MVIAALCFVALLFFGLRALRRRKAVLAGLHATRPVFFSEPPARRIGKPGRF